MKDWNWNRITDWILGLTIFFVMMVSLTAPLWLCVFMADCSVS